MGHLLQFTASNAMANGTYFNTRDELAHKILAILKQETGLEPEFYEKALKYLIKSSLKLITVFMFWMNNEYQILNETIAYKPINSSQTYLLHFSSLAYIIYDNTKIHYTSEPINKSYEKLPKLFTNIITTIISSNDWYFQGDWINN